MKQDRPIPSTEYDQVTQGPAGYRDKRGEWRPEKPVAYAPVFEWPLHAKRFLGWLKAYLFPWNLFYFGVTLATWLYFQPTLERCRTFEIGWIAQMFVRNQILLWVWYGGWHLWLYSFKKHGHRGKYSPRWMNTNGATYLFKNQIHDNIFWTCVSGGITWTAYEVLTMWMYANGRLPYIDFRTSPLMFMAVLLLIPIWREFHFYWIHRLIHWKPLYDRIHYLHHYNINPGPWSGMAMHPLEHLLYFSVTLIHWIVPSHPIHFLFNAQHTALTPAPGHTGFEGKLADQVGFGSYFHYLHHRHFDCNYGEVTIPLDKWFGSFEDGSRTDSERSEAKRTYHDYVIDRIVAESPEVKSFYLRRTDGALQEPHLPGQHLMFKIPASEGDKTALRFYTLSDADYENHYRISVKREGPPSDAPDAAPGLVSNYLHDHCAEGDRLEARGPLGDFSPSLTSKRPLVLIAGGIGITPILAMLKGALQQHPGRRIQLFLSFKDTAREVFRDEIAALTKAHPSLRCTTCFTGGDAVERSDARAGRITVPLLQETMGRLDGDFYICGPAVMMQDLVEGLQAAGVSEQHVHTESFNAGGGDGAVTTEQHEITFARSGKTIRWDSEFRNLLEFAESNGISMEAGCMFGECGACSCKVESGDVRYNYATATKPQAGHCLPCSSQPASPLVIDA